MRYLVDPETRTVRVTTRPTFTALTTGEVSYADFCKIRMQPGWTDISDTYLIIAGSREFDDQEQLNHVMDAYHLRMANIRCVIHGAARGADQMGAHWALISDIQRQSMPADWDGVERKGAGHFRNMMMTRCATHLVAFWNGYSPGTVGMIDRARHAGLIVEVKTYL